MDNVFLGKPTVEFCEKAGSGFVKRPWYLISNLAFFVSGILILRKGKYDYLSQLFGGVVIFIGLFSSVYDITFTRWSQLIDLSGMILFISLLIYLTLLSITRLTKAWALFILLAVYVLSFASMLYFGSISGNIIFGLYVMFLICTEIVAYRIKAHTQYKPFLQSLLLFAIAFAYWLTDISQTICFRFGLLNGRSVLHFLSAISMYLLYTFYASQKAVLRIK